MINARERILSAATALFDTEGVEGTSVAAICRAAGVSNGSFFHAFSTKEVLGAELFLAALESYHAAMLAAVADRPDAAGGVRGLVQAHLDWVVSSRIQARFLFEQSRSAWIVHVRERQAVENEQFAQRLDEWRLPLVRAGHLLDLPRGVFIAQLIGPSQIFCRAWLSGRSTADPREQASALIDCADRALRG
jgi:AcrR family transcriptional regulator